MTGSDEQITCRHCNHTRQSPRHDSNTTQDDEHTHASSQHDEEEKHKSHDSPRRLSFREKFRMRIHHFTFAWFASTMSTGGLAVTINTLPLMFGTTQRVLGLISFFYDIVAFCILSCLMITRFVMYPSTFRNALMHPHESMFVPCFFLSIASIILCINSFGVPYCGPWLPVVLRVLFWTYLSITFPFSLFIFYAQFMHARETMNSMAPTWCLGIFQVMLSGTIASQVATSQNSTNGVPMIIAGIMIQGLGFWVSLCIIGIFFQKIFTSTEMPAPSMRFGFFMFVGAPGFTTLALVGLGRAASTDGVFYMDFILGSPGAANIARVFLDLFGAFFWGLTAWLSAFAFLSVIMGFFSGPKFGSEMTFNLSWFAFGFPNVGFIIGTMLLAEEFSSTPLKIVTAVMLVVLAIGVVSLWCMAIRAVIKEQIMMPGKDEDKAIPSYKGEFDKFEDRYPMEVAYKMA